MRQNADGIVTPEIARESVNVVAKGVAIDRARQSGRGLYLDARQVSKFFHIQDGWRYAMFHINHIIQRQKRLSELPKIEDTAVMFQGAEVPEVSFYKPADSEDEYVSVADFIGVLVAMQNGIGQGMSSSTLAGLSERFKITQRYLRSFIYDRSRESRFGKEDVAPKLIALLRSKMEMLDCYYRNDQSVTEELRAIMNEAPLELFIDEDLKMLPKEIQAEIRAVKKGRAEDNDGVSSSA